MLVNLRQASKRLKISVPALRQYIKESGITITIYRGTLRVELTGLEKITKDREGPGEKKCEGKCSSAWINKALTEFRDGLRQK